MSEPRDLLVNFERMRREMDDLFEDVWGRTGYAPRPASGFSPRVDVYYCDDGETPKAIVTAELPGVTIDDVTLEVSGRELMIGGRRETSDTTARVYQQIEIPRGAFRRVIQLGADVDAEGAQASFEDGVLRIELPLRSPERASRTVPIDPQR